MTLFMHSSLKEIGDIHGGTVLPVLTAIAGESYQMPLEYPSNLVSCIDTRHSDYLLSSKDDCEEMQAMPLEHPSWRAVSMRAILIT